MAILINKASKVEDYRSDFENKIIKDFLDFLVEYKGEEFSVNDSVSNFMGNYKPDISISDGRIDRYVERMLFLYRWLDIEPEERDFTVYDFVYCTILMFFRDNNLEEHEFSIEEVDSKDFPEYKIDGESVKLNLPLENDGFKLTIEEKQEWIVTNEINLSKEDLCYMLNVDEKDLEKQLKAEMVDSDNLFAILCNEGVDMKEVKSTYCRSTGSKILSITDNKTKKSL